MVHTNITLSKTNRDDLDLLYQFQIDNEANYMAAFTSKESSDKTAYIEKHTKFLSDPTINMMTIKSDNVIVGSVAKFLMENELEITYWIDRYFWGQGIATAALKEFLKIEKTRPLNARAVIDNYGSQKVLEKCGFIRIGKDKGFANARQAETEEFIYKLLN